MSYRLYVTASGSFKVWKDASSNKILRANGLDEWAMKLNPNGKGFQGAGNEFTDYTSIEGRKCPPSVYISDSDRVSANKCLYYTAGYAAQTPSTAGLLDWFNFNGGQPRWFVANITTCSNIGMRLPVLFETNTTYISDAFYPTDASPTFAGASNGIPNHPSGMTWTASAHTQNVYYFYWKWQGSSVHASKSNTSYYVRCVLP